MYCLKSGSNDIFTYSRSGEFDITNPFGFGPCPPRFNSVCGKYQYTQPFVGSIANGEIIENGLSVTPDGDIILDAALSRRDRVEQYYVNQLEEFVRSIYNINNGYNTKRASQNGYDYEVACSLIHHPVPPAERGSHKSISGGYAGIIMSLLTSMAGVDEFKKRTGKHPTLLYHREPPAFLVEFLDILGFDTNKLVIWDGKPKRIRRLVVPSIRRAEHNMSFYHHRLNWPARHKFVPPEACDWLRETAVENLSAEAKKVETSDRIYLSREDANRRRVTNRDELLAELEPRGFKKYVATDLSVEQQVYLFSQSEAVVSPHGAGLANIIFSEDSAVVELFGKKTKPTFFMLSESLDHDYRYIRGDSVGRDIHIDPTAVNQVLNDVLPD